MKTVYFIISSVLLLSTLAPANAQRFGDSRNKVIIVNDSGQDDVVSIVKDKSQQNVRMTVAGFQIDFSNGSLIPPGKRWHSPVSVDVDNDSDNIQVGVGISNSYLYAKKMNWHWFPSIGNISFGFNGFTTPDYSRYADPDYDFLSLRTGRSMSVSLNFIQFSTPFRYLGNVGVMTSLGIKWNDYVFSERITVGKIDGILQPLPISENMSRYKKSKINTFSITAPIMLTVKLGGSAYIGAGAYGDLIIGQHTKIKKPKSKDFRGNLGINSFQGGLTARIGFGSFYIFGNYGLSNMFKSGVGPKTQPFTVGFGF